jgi:hypothetical protein
MLKKMLKPLAGLASALLVTGSYATCWTYSGNNCVYEGQTHTITISCQSPGGGTFSYTRVASAENALAPGDYAVTPVVPGNTYFSSRQYVTTGCTVPWDYLDCNGVRQPLQASLTGYYRVSGDQNCVFAP